MHPFHAHRDMQRGHRRVGEVLKGHPDGATKHADGGAFSRVTSKTAAADHDRSVAGSKSPKRYARGGKVKGATTNIAIVLPGSSAAPDMPSAVPGPTGGPPVPMGGPPPLPPGMPPGMPMRAKGGRVNGESTKENIGAMAKRAAKNSYFRGGAASGVGREEKAAHMKRKGK